jgi:hypothetical protein
MVQMVEERVELTEEKKMELMEGLVPIVDKKGEDDN